MTTDAEQSPLETHRVTLPLSGRTVVVLGGSSGIGLAVALAARAADADVIITGRDAVRLDDAAQQVFGARTAVFDVNDHVALAKFFDDLEQPIDHVFVGAGAPYYARLADVDLDQARTALSASTLLMLDLARLAPPKMTPGGTLLFMGGTAARRPALGMTVIGAMAAAASATVANLALEIAPMRISLLAAGFVDTPLSARLLGNDLDARRTELARTLPVRRVVQADDVAALALQLMINPVLTGAVYDVDGGQQLVE